MKRLRDIFIIFIFVLIIVGAYNTLKFFGFNFNNNTFIDYVSNDFNYIKTPTKDVNRNNIKFYDIINYEYKKIAFNKAKPTIPKEVEVIKNTKDTKEPIVYIYNTHQKEEYTVEKNEPYNITPTVLTTSYMLEEQLLKHGIKSVVEESSVSEVLNKNKWNYASSYKVTKTFLEKAKEKYPSLKFYIDVHRDSVKYSITTKTINDKKYARVMFLIGLENKNYEENLKVTEAINNEVEKKYINKILSCFTFYKKNNKFDIKKILLQIQYEMEDETALKYCDDETLFKTQKLPYSYNLSNKMNK